MDSVSVKLAPSILSADFAHLGKQVADAQQPVPIEFMSTLWMDTDEA